MMRRNFFLTSLVLSGMLLALTLSSFSADKPVWVHPSCQALDIGKKGPFVLMADGALATVDEKGFSLSYDRGRSWSEPVFVCSGLNSKEPASYYLLRTKDNVLILVYLNFTDKRFYWDQEKNEPGDCQLEVWSIRSLDGGKTWIDNQRLLSGYNPNFFGLIQTSSGRVVVPLQHLVSNPGRLVVCSFYSDDDGLTWSRSNWIDLGGHGHHDGAFEPAIAELPDGRLLMLIRTGLDRFWQAISEDARYWRKIEPSLVEASSSPGYLLKLQSGRLVLIWNRLNPEGRIWPKTKPTPFHSELPASWHREELSLAFSDDGFNWSKPVVIARQPGGQLSYPYVFEPEPGVIWVIAGFAFKRTWEEPFELKLKLLEKDFIPKTD
ncbi:MAG TPA: sialidase family protein, partial [Candidatus Saccharicenans sp.]|nr:sialidase family protein [Candidatus Saccharicenans sp.]